MKAIELCNKNHNQMKKETFYKKKKMNNKKKKTEKKRLQVEMHTLKFIIPDQFFFFFPSLFASLA